MKIDTTNAIEIDGFFRRTRRGDEVFQTEARNLWRWGQVEVGSVIDPEDDETLEKIGRPFVVAAIGSEFEVEGTAFVYLYLSEPIRKRVAINREYSEDVDGSEGQLESDRIAEQNRTGELDR